MAERARAIFRQRRSEARAAHSSSVPGDQPSGSVSASSGVSTVLLSPRLTPDSKPPGETTVVGTATNLALNRWMSFDRPGEKPTRALAVDSFEWLPEPRQPAPIQTFRAVSRRSISPFEESPSPAPSSEAEMQEEWLTHLQTTAFLDGFDFGKTEHGASGSRSPMDSVAASASTTRDESAIAIKGASLLDRVSKRRSPSSAPCTESMSAVGSQPRNPQAAVPFPSGAVPREVTRTWSTILVYSVINDLPTEEVWSIIARDGLPEPAAIQIKRLARGKRFALVFAAYRTPEERDKSAAGLDGVGYGSQGLKLVIKDTDKPPSAYTWEWQTTSERFRLEHFERERALEDQRRSEQERCSKRRRLSSAGQPSSPPRVDLNSPPSARSSYHRPLSPPLPLRSPSGRRSKSPVYERASYTRPAARLDDPVPVTIVDRLHSMLLNNLPPHVTRAEILSFFPPRSIVGLAVNHPQDESYPQDRQGRRPGRGSAFFLFESGSARDHFAKSHCIKKVFPRGTQQLWYDYHSQRYDPWLWRDMIEEWASKNGGPPLEDFARESSPVPDRSRRVSPTWSLGSASVSSDRMSRTREYSDSQASFATFHPPTAPLALRNTATPSLGPTLPGVSVYERRAEALSTVAPPARKRATWSEEPDDFLPSATPAAPGLTFGAVPPPQHSHAPPSTARYDPYALNPSVSHNSFYAPTGSAGFTQSYHDSYAQPEVARRYEYVGGTEGKWD